MSYSMGPLVLLLCGLSFSGLDVCRKKLALRFSPLRIMTLLMGAQIPFYAIWYWYTGMPHFSLAQYWSYGLADMVANISANLLIVMALRLSPLSNAVPLLALTPCFSLLFQQLFQFPVTVLQIAGALIIFMGAVILNGVPRLHSKKDRGLIIMTMAAMICGILILFDQRCLTFVSISFHGLVQTTAMTIAMLVCERIFKIPPKEFNMGLHEAPLKWWIGGSVAAFLAGVGQLGSLAFYTPGTVESVKRALVLFLSVTFGSIFFREKLTKKKILAVACMAVGIYFITS